MPSDIADLSTRNVRVSTRDIRAIRFLVEKASKKIHSDGRISREDKTMILGTLAGAKKRLDKILQLEMFPQHALE